MGYLESQVEKLEKRIQKIKANPDPTKAGSNLLLYEAELEQRKAQIAGLQEGRPFIDAAGQLYIIAKAMGFELSNAVLAAERLPPEKVPYYSDQVKQLGFPDSYCDRLILSLPLAKEMPRVKMILYSLGACELRGLICYTAGHLLNVPVFIINVPFDDDNRSQLGYVARQLEEFIAFAEENVPGIKYDEDKLKGMLEVEKEWYALHCQIYQLRKRVPCPSHPQDVFRLPPNAGNYPNPGKIIQYLRAVRDELLAKVERGYSPVKEERLRLMWTTTGPFGSNIWDLLSERGVTVPFVHFGSTANYPGLGYRGVGDTTEFGHKLSPIEEVARLLMGHGLGGTAKRWIDQAMFACREWKIDAIVNFDQEGCAATIGFSRLLKAAAERQLGIPALNIVGRELMRTKEEEEQFLEQVDNFITSCLKKKGF